MFPPSKRKLTLKVALSFFLVVSIAAPGVQPCFAKVHPEYRPVVVSEKPTLDLIEKLAHQPELMTPEYLQYILGRPAKRNVSDASNVGYHWVTNEGGIGSQDCELVETRDANHKIIKATFKVNLPRSTTTITDIEKKINGDADMLSSNNSRPYLPQSGASPSMTPPSNLLPTNPLPITAPPINAPSANLPSVTPSLPSNPISSGGAASTNAMSGSPTGSLASTDSLDPFNIPLSNSSGSPPSLANLIATANSMPPSNATSATPTQLRPPISQTASSTPNVVSNSAPANLSSAPNTWPNTVPTGVSNTAPTAASASPSQLSSQAGTPSAPVYSPSTVPRVQVKHLFDQQCRPALQYSFVPYTNVFYMQAPNTFHVHHAEIVYAGPPLPPPNQADIADVANGMRTRALAHHAKDSHNLAIPMLSDHLIDNPADAEAHYALGLSYQKSSNLNAAIGEYQLALRYSNGDETVTNKAVQSLQQLHVLPSPDDKFDYHTLRFKQNGQGLTEGDVIATQDRQSLVANRTPIYTTNAPMYAAPAPSYANYQGSAPRYGNSAPAYASAAPYPQSGPRGVSYTPYNAPYNAPGVSPANQPRSFYDSMNYGNNLFPATATNPNLEPGF